MNSPFRTSPSRQSRAAHLHVIRLHGPWIELDDAGNEVRHRVPLDLDRFARTHRNHSRRKSLALRRRFGRPSGVTSSDRVYLAWHGGDLPVTLQLNDLPPESVPAWTDYRLDVTSLLKPRNEIRLGFAELPPAAAADSPCWLVRSVTLEIESGDRDRG